jgi:hypothetical protein
MTDEQDPVILAQAGINLELKTTSKWILDHLRYRASRMTDEQDPSSWRRPGSILNLRPHQNGFWITRAAARPERRMNKTCHRGAGRDPP